MATSKPYSSIIGGSNAHFAGVDQGIDFTGTGVVYAADQAKITRIVPSGAGWHVPGGGSELDYLLQGGSGKGKSVYVAEDFKIASGLSVGQVVPKGTVLGSFSSTWPGIETGFANPGGGPAAPLPPPRPASQWTSQGGLFDLFAGGTGGSIPASATGDHMPVLAIPTGGIGAAGAGAGAGLAAGEGAAAGAAAGAAGSGLAGLLGAGALILYLETKYGKNWLQRGAEMAGGGVLLLLAFGLAGFSAVSRVAAPVQPVARAVAAPRQRRQRAAATAQRQQVTAQRSQARESRAGELHAARVSTERARATNIRSQSRARSTAARQTKEQRAAAEQRAYFRGAADAGR